MNFSLEALHLVRTIALTGPSLNCLTIYGNQAMTDSVKRKNGGNLGLANAGCEFSLIVRAPSGGGV